MADHDDNNMMMVFWIFDDGGGVGVRGWGWLYCVVRVPTLRPLCRIGAEDAQK